VAEGSSGVGNFRTTETVSDMGCASYLSHRRPCAGFLFAHVRAMYEKDIRLFSADGKRQDIRRAHNERGDRDGSRTSARH